MAIFHPADGLPGKWKNQASAQLPQASMPHAQLTEPLDLATRSNAVA
jgi:hypothetical protein